VSVCGTTHKKFDPTTEDGAGDEIETEEKEEDNKGMFVGKKV
jgi:hypothetical protein